MNWSRAKTILIVTFLILNLFLVVQLKFQRNSSIPYTEYEEVNKGTLSLLRDKYNVEVFFDSLPKGLSPSKNPEVGWKLVHKEKLLKEIWPNKELELTEEGIVKLENEYLIVGEYDYYYHNDDLGKRLIDKSFLIKHIIESIKDPQHLRLISSNLKYQLQEALGIGFESWKVDTINKVVENNEDIYVINFNQYMELDIHDVSSYTRVKINSEGRITEVRRSELEKKNSDKTFLEKIKEAVTFDTKTKKITAAEALLFFVGQKPYEGNIIISDIKLVYYGLTQDDFNQGNNTPLKWHLTPVWKISIIDENNLYQNFYLDSYTGKLE